jgi:hypothetical protein
VSEDLPDATYEETLQVIKISGDYGRYIHPEDESSDGLEYQRRLVEKHAARRNEGVSVKREPEEVMIRSVTEGGNEVWVIDDD